MNVFTVLSSAFYSITGVVSVVFAVLYLFRRQIMPYHAQALGTDADDLDPRFQVVLKAMMRVIGGGFFTATVAVVFFLSSPRHLFSSWGKIALPAILLPISLSAVIATLRIKRNTNANPPWKIALAVLLLLIMAMTFSFLASAAEA
jgi:hypothetical protein